MAEAEVVPVPPRDPAQNPQPGPTSNWEHRGLLSLAALGATFGFLTGMGVWAETHSNPVEFLLSAGILGLAAYVLFDPGVDWVYERLGAPRPEFAEGRKEAAVAMVVLATLAVAGLDHALGHTLELSEEGTVRDVIASMHLGGLGGALIVLCCVGSAAFFVTHFGWVRGVQRHPRRAAQRGAIAGLIFGVASALLLLGLLKANRLIPSWGWGSLLVVLGLLWFFGPGVLGGWAINKCQGNTSPCSCILRHLLLFSFGYGFLLLAAAYTFGSSFPGSKGDEAWVLLPISALIGQNLGWALAPYFRRTICDRYLGFSGTCGDTPPEGRKTGQVVSIRDGGPSTPASGADEKPTPPAEMLLKPTGDRLWATVALVLMLVVAGLAYYAGTMRKDPEIINNILIRLQEDSGLQQKGLEVHSAGRVVTLAGRVDNEFEHEKAVQEAASVRGVKQVIDQIQVAPTPPAARPTPAPTVVAPVQPPAPVPNAMAPVVASQAPIKASPAGAQKHPETQKAASAQKPHEATHPAKANKQVNTASAEKQAETPKTADTQKKGFLGFLKNNNPVATTDAEKQGATSTTADTQKSTTADTQKKGFFHFLKKNNNKDRNQTNSNASH